MKVLFTNKAPGLKKQQPGKLFSRSRAFAAALGLCMAIAGPSLLPQVLAPTAHAGPEVNIYPPIEDLKDQARSYRGTISYQVWLGDIYSKNLSERNDGDARAMASHFKTDLFDSAQRNRIEAYFWYSLAAAQLTFGDLLKSIPASETFTPPTLTTEEEKLATYAWSRMQALKKSSWRNKIVGPSFWTAEKLFVDVYREGGYEAHYIMAQLYKGSDTGFVVKSDYDAFVWMLAASMQGFGDSEVQSQTYQGEILYSQKYLASLAAERIVAFSAAVSAQGTTPYGSAIMSTQGGVMAKPSRTWNAAPQLTSGRKPSSQPQVNWASDFQSARAGNNLGNVSLALPAGVDTHHSSRAAFNIGNGHLAAGNIAQAKTYFEYAIAREPYSRAAIDASRQLQALTMTCSMKDDRVSRMASGGNRDRVHDIRWNRLQMALKALGYYTAYVDGKPGQETRRAIRDFQRGELNVDDTGYLTTDQRVELICLAAQDVRDAESQIQLGIMYARGIGLNCNTAAAHAWFQKAADQGHPTALYNLGLMYLEGFYDRHAPGAVPYSTEENPTPPRRVIDPDVARYFFSEAGDRGHPGASGKLSKIDKHGAAALMQERGVIGCIDYEAEVALAQYETRVATLSAEVKNTSAGSCAQLQSQKTSQAMLAKETAGLWNEIGKYDEHMGQSDRKVERRPINQVRQILKNTTTELDAKLSTCSDPLRG